MQVNWQVQVHRSFLAHSKVENAENEWLPISKAIVGVGDIDSNLEYDCFPPFSDKSIWKKKKHYMCVCVYISILYTFMSKATAAISTYSLSLHLSLHHWLCNWWESLSHSHAHISILNDRNYALYYYRKIIRREN